MALRGSPQKVMKYIRMTVERGEDCCKRQAHRTPRCVTTGLHRQRHLASVMNSKASAKISSFDQKPAVDQWCKPAKLSVPANIACGRDWNAIAQTTHQAHVVGYSHIVQLNTLWHCWFPCVGIWFFTMATNPVCTIDGFCAVWMSMRYFIIAPKFVRDGVRRVPLRESLHQKT